MGSINNRSLNTIKGEIISHIEFTILMCDLKIIPKRVVNFDRDLWPSVKSGALVLNYVHAPKNTKKIHVCRFSLHCI